MKRQDFRFFEPLRVRWAEIDAQGIVFNGHYLTYMDTAISGYWRALALPYADTMKQLGGDLFVRVRRWTTSLGPLRRPPGHRRALPRIRQQLDEGRRGVFRGEQLLVQADMVYVFADPAAQTPQRLPDALREVIHGFEAGQSVVDVSVGAWSEHGDAAGAIRREVFIEEQGIPADMEWDAADASCLHALAATASAFRWPPAACWSTCPASPRSAAWPCCAPCAAPRSAARCSTR
jgi:acyl-CoA thioesterase FadM